jgi:hypothetical protein
MNKTVQQRLFNYWHPMRWVALVAGSSFLGMGAWHGDMVSVVIGGFFLFQAATNTGCLCGNCSVPAQNSAKSGDKNINDVAFTEIKED